MSPQTWPPDGSVAISELDFDPATQAELAAEATARAAADAVAIVSTLVNAKGDLLVGTADDVVGRLAVGGEGTIPVSRGAATTGVAWEAPGAGYTDAQVKAVLAALASGEKIAWEQPAGTDVVEVWAERIAAGAYQTIYTDNFDDLDVVGWTQDIGAWSAVAPGQARIAANSADDLASIAQMSFLGAASTQDMRVGAFLSAGGGVAQGVTIRKGANDHIFVRITPNNMTIYKVTGGVATQLAFLSASSMANVSGYVRYSRTGNVLLAEWWKNGTGPSGAPTHSTSYTLAGSDATNYGAGVSVAPGLAQGDLNQRQDTFTVETSAGEQRDLYVAVTPLGGTRTVKRVLGAEGGSIRASDIPTTGQASTGAVAAGASADVVVALNAAFPSTGYKAFAMVEENTAGEDNLRVLRIVAKTKSSVTVRVKNDAAGARTGAVYVNAIP